jgi:hypothetical protein
MAALLQMAGQRSHWIDVTGQVWTDATYFHVQNIRGTTVPRIGGTRPLLGDSRHAELSRCDSGNPLEMEAELALV